jgi:5S rRNA maturation endonuclease (ribonuclease M5)
MSVAEIQQSHEGLIDELIEHLGAKPSGNGYLARCHVPAHIDNNPSLTFTVANNGQWVWMECRSRCNFDEVLEALPSRFHDFVRESGATTPKASIKRAANWKHPVAEAKATKKESIPLGRIVATYDYPDADGTLIYQVVRYDPKDFRQRRPNGHGGWIGDIKGVTPTIYHLPEVLAAAKAGKIIFVTEGEKDADALRSVGVVATCNSGGAEKFRSEFVDYFNGAKEVVVVADNDDKGMKHARQVSTFMTARSIPVRVMKAAEGKDPADHLAAGFGVDDFVPVDDSEMPTLSLVTDITPDAGGEEDVSAAVLMMRHLEKFYDLGCDHEHTPWAVLKVGSRVAVPVERNGQLARHLMSAHYDRYGYFPSDAAANSVCSRAHVLAENSPTPIKPALRVTFIDGHVIVDLGRRDGQVLTISPGGWSVGPDAHNAVWRRTSLNGEMPIPERGGDINLLRDHVRVSDKDWPITVAWMVQAWRSDRQCPIVSTGGPAGSAKTSFAQRLLDLLDPAGENETAISNAPPDPKTWSVSAAAGRVIGVDNVERIPKWWANALCTAVTGAVDIERTLQTNSEITTRRIKRAIIFTGVAVGTLPSDLTERIISIELEPVLDTERRTERDLDAAWRRDQATILGGLADVVVKVLAEFESFVSPKTMPRMADFYETLLCVDAVLGTDGATTYLNSSKDLQGEIAEGEPVAQALARLMAEREIWEGTKTSLLDALTPSEPDRWWPHSAQALGAKLKKLAAPLREIGIHISDQPRGHGGARMIVITRTAKSTSSESPTSVDDFDGDTGFDDATYETPTLVDATPAPSQLKLAPENGRCSDCGVDAVGLVPVGAPARLICESCHLTTDDF